MISAVRACLIPAVHQGARAASAAMTATSGEPRACSAALRPPGILRFHWVFTMGANELLRSGQLSAAIAQVTEEVKAKPADYRGRSFLFDLLCFSGDLDRAARQLEVLAQENAEAEIGVQPYRNLLEGERARRRLFSDGVWPHLLPETPSYTELHFEALNCIRQGQPSQARSLLERAELSRPALFGQLNGNQPFDDFKDCDDLVGPFLEAIIRSEYSWVPWEAVSSISIEPPKYSRDLIWIPARIELRTGEAGEAFLPVLYAESYLHSDERVKLGRVTEWRANVQEVALGLGQRLFAVGENDFPMLEVREIRFEHANTTSH
jgi:type VI secretion system protein ImpE